MKEIPKDAKFYKKEIKCLINFLDTIGEYNETRAIISEDELNDDEIIKIFKKSELFKNICNYSKKVYNINRSNLKNMDKDKRKKIIDRILNSTEEKCYIFEEK